MVHHFSLSKNRGLVIGSVNTLKGHVRDAQSGTGLYSYFDIWYNKSKPCYLGTPGNPSSCLIQELYHEVFWVHSMREQLNTNLIPQPIENND